MLNRDNEYYLWNKEEKVMKSFFGTFVICLILCYAFLLFGGGFILGNIWATLVFVALIITILITILIHQETKIEELETRIKILESQSES